MSLQKTVGQDFLKTLEFTQLQVATHNIVQRKSTQNAGIARDITVGPRFNGPPI